MANSNKAAPAKPSKTASSGVTKRPRISPQTLTSQRRMEMIRAMEAVANGTTGTPSKAKAAKPASPKRGSIVEFGTYRAQTAKPAKKASSHFKVGMPASTETKLSAVTLEKIAAGFSTK